MTPPRVPSMEDIARALGLTSKRHPKVTETRILSQGRGHAPDPRACGCDDGDCIAAAIKLTGLRDAVRRDADTAYDRPPPARCDDPAELLRDDDDPAVVAARRGAR